MEISFYLIFVFNKENRASMMEKKYFFVANQIVANL